MAIRQAPVSVGKLKDQVDSCYKVNNSPNPKRGVELMNEGTSWQMISEIGCRHVHGFQQQVG